MCTPKKKCMRAGPMTSNGFFNYMREYRKKNCGLTAVEAVRCGAKRWNRLTCAQKAKYRRMGCKPQRKKRRSCSRRRTRPRRRSCSRRRKPRRSSCKRKRKPKRRSCSRRRKSRPRKAKRCGGRRKKCMKPGPVTNNGFLNFLRSFRRKHCGLTPIETVRRAARKWCSLPQAKRDRYNRQACKFATSKRMRNSPLCRAVRRDAAKRRRRC